MRLRASMHAPISNSPTPPIASPQFSETYPRTSGLSYTPSSPRDCEVATNGLRGEIGVVWVSIHIRPVLPGAMDEIPCVQGPEIARGALPLRRLGGGGQAKPEASTRSPRAVVKLAGRRQDPDINPGRVARLRSHFHADYRLRDRSLAMPLAQAANVDTPGAPGVPDASARPQTLATQRI